MLLTCGEHVINSTANDGSNTGCDFAVEENISRVDSPQRVGEGETNEASIGEVEGEANSSSSSNVVPTTKSLISKSMLAKSCSSKSNSNKSDTIALALSETNTSTASKSIVAKSCSSKSNSSKSDTSHQSRMNVTVVSNLGQKIVQRFQCKGCMRCFGNTSGLTRHSAHCNNSSIENILSTASIRFECSRCKKSFSSKGYLKQHLLNSKYCKRLAEDSIALALSETNSSTASLTCNGCNKEFTQRNGLTNHRKFCHELTSKESSGSRVEESEVAEISLTNPLLCMKCNKVFKNKGGLTTDRKYCKGYVKLRSLLIRN